MTIITTIIDFISLGLQLVGAVIMYRNSPVNQMPWGSTFADASMFRKKFKKKNDWLRYGFLILAVGVCLSLASLFIKTFYPH